MKCRHCGCTDTQACPGGCYWAAPEVCSACADRLDVESAAPRAAAPVYYHGGPRGRQIGTLLLPPCRTRAATTADYGARGVCRRDRVYVTTDRNAALLYASGSHKGVIYEVEPIGELAPDPDCNRPGLSFECESARVKRIIKPDRTVLAMARRVLLTP